MRGIAEMVYRGYRQSLGSITRTPKYPPPEAV